MRSLGRTVCLTALLLLGARPVRAEAGRYAIVVGDNHGDGSELVLRYSESDAHRMADVLRSVGGFYPENITTLTNVAAEDVRRALIGLNARLRQSQGHSLLFVFYSGHADALHLAGTRLSLTELRDLAAGSPAEARVLVVDSCRSGVLTRVKGARPAQPFDIRVDVPAPAQGLAILTSSAAGEDSQESDQLGASIFTHHLLSGLRGAADRNHRHNHRHNHHPHSRSLCCPQHADQWAGGTGRGGSGRPRPTQRGWHYGRRCIRQLPVHGGGCGRHLPHAQTGGRGDGGG